MNLFGWVLLLAVVVVAAADGHLAVYQRRAASALGPSAAAVLLAAFAWLAHAEATTSGRLLLVGLLVTLVAGPLLRRSRETGPRAVAALAATLLARLLLVGAVLALPPVRGAGPGAPAVLLVGSALLLGGVALWSLRALGGDPATRGVLTAYGVLVLLAVALAAWHGVALAAGGLAALAAADLAIGWSWLSRRPLPQLVPLLALLGRHLGLLLVVVGVVRPDLTA